MYQKKTEKRERMIKCQVQSRMFGCCCCYCWYKRKKKKPKQSVYLDCFFYCVCFCHGLISINTCNSFSFFFVSFFCFFFFVLHSNLTTIQYINARNKRITKQKKTQKQYHIEFFTCIKKERQNLNYLSYITTQNQRNNLKFINMNV